MRKIGLVTSREYLRRVNKKSFILLTIFAPLLFAGIVFVPLWLSSIKNDEVYNISIIDRTGKYAGLFSDTDNFHFEKVGASESPDKLRSGKSSIFAFLEISDDLLKNPKAAALYSEKQIPKDLKREVDNVLSRYLEDEKRSSFNIPNLDEIIKASNVKFDIMTIKWQKDGTATESSSEIGSVIGFIFTFVIYMFLIMYGAMVMHGVMEEKTNRIVEIMVSSVNPFDLMMGKILGIGLVGLTQALIWCVLTAGLVGAGTLLLGLGGAGAEGMPLQVGMPAVEAPEGALGVLAKLRSFNFVEIIVYFVLFFIGGYVSYASLFAATGSMVDSPDDAQQFMMPMMVLMIFAVYAGMYSLNNPDGPLAFWCSLIPFTSPMVMMVRIPYEIPFWQVLVSLALLYASAIFFVWVSAKIYRVGILMYGKKPNLRDIVRWVRLS